uniref:Endonuclease/exonuclease/phosphatase domain-containing protein n=1 Tax=Cannabis sativa TaxID=3483 RepID=A0A803PSW2_CANSA
MHCYVQSQQQVGKFFVSLIYAFNDEKKREELWADLEELAKKINEPWILMGYFNEIMNGDERIGRRAQCIPSQRLQDCMENCNMADLKYSGSFYTWNNKQQPEERIFSKIDRAMVNSHWINAFPCSEAVFLPELSFDHSPILVTIYEDRFCGRKPFRYFNMWKQAAEYDELVSKAWEGNITGTKMYDRRKVVQAIVDLGPKITSIHKDILLADYTRKEVEDAIFAIDRDKAPGPDGYGSAFFQDNWKLSNGGSVVDRCGRSDGAKLVMAISDSWLLAGVNWFELAASSTWWRSRLKMARLGGSTREMVISSGTVVGSKCVCLGDFGGATAVGQSD